MAVGSGYPETGSINESSVHWDMICDLRQGGEIHVDGELCIKMESSFWTCKPVERLV
jgi:aminopeptidase